MVQGVYVYWKDVFNPSLSLTGIDNKVKDQITLLNQNNLHCSLVVAPPVSQSKRLSSMLLHMRDHMTIWPPMESLKNADYLYMRRPSFVTAEYIEWLKKVKETYPNIKIIYEIPTYPYDGEGTGLLGLYTRIKDTRNRRDLHKYIDYIADLSGESEIFGIPTIPITNGMVISKTPIRTPKHQQFSTSVDILCVAFFSKWHGIDRFLEGMRNYYSTSSSEKIHIRLHLVGGGNRRYINRLKKLTIRYHLQDFVIFHAPVARDKLDTFYDLCDFAIESLGVHRRKIAKYSYSIKSREYLTRGMPFIFSTPIDLEQYAPIPFCFKASEDEEPIDIAALLNYYQNIYKVHDEEEVAQQLRAYAEKYVSIEKAFAPVINYLKTI